ncbi:MAG: hypothetical protein M1608_06505 [Candidatus Omnitrophica bacterium]|nr:hypothetical protein [Candidatus Omnitrophota bacterium]
MRTKVIQIRNLLRGLVSTFQSSASLLRFSLLDAFFQRGAADRLGTGPDVGPLQHKLPPPKRCWAALCLGLLWILPGSLLAQSAGQLQFVSANYSEVENRGFAVISVTRTGGSTGIVTVDYRTVGGTATAGVDYLVQSGTLTFADGETNQTFTVIFFDNAVANPNKTVDLALSDRKAGAQLGSPSNATLTIVDDETVIVQKPAGQFQFSASSYLVSESESYIWRDDLLARTSPGDPIWTQYRAVPGALITVTRTGGSTGRVLVDYATTTNGTATPNSNYRPVSGTLIFEDYQMSTNFVVPIIDDYMGSGTVILPDGSTNISDIKTVDLVLSNPRPAPEEDPNIIAPSLGSVSNTVLQIGDDDSNYSIARAAYRVDEYQTNINITVTRGIYATNSGTLHYDIIYPHSLQPGSDYAKPDLDFTNVSGTFSWGQDDYTPRNILLPIIPDSTVEFNEDIFVRIFLLPGDTATPIGPVHISPCTILFNDQPAGALDRDHNPDMTFYTTPPFNTTPGANKPVYATAVQDDLKTVIAGEFTAFNTIERNRIARMNLDGSNDNTFTPGTGADNYIDTLTIYPAYGGNLSLAGKMIIGGGFTSYNGVQRYHIARLNSDGTLDTTFNPALGTDGTVRSAAIQGDGKVVIGGEFTSVNGTNRNYVARLNTDGSLDTSFDPGLGPSDFVSSVAIAGPPAFEIQGGQWGYGPTEYRTNVFTGSTSGRVTLYYDFLDIPDTIHVYYDTNLVYDTGLVSGTNVVSFTYGPGKSQELTIVVNEGSGDPYTVWIFQAYIQTTGIEEKVMIGGDFTSVNGIGRNRIARLHNDGSVDTAFDPGTGADGLVYSVAMQRDGKVLIGGAFSSVDVRSRNSIARLNSDGTLDTSFNPGSGFDDSVYAITVQPDGRPLVGGIFTKYNGTRRVGLARLNTDATLDTSFMDTAYNQFAGPINPSYFDPSNPSRLYPKNYIKTIAAYQIATTNFVSVTTSNVVDGTNVVVLQPNVVTQDKVIIGGGFHRLGGSPSLYAVEPKTWEEFTRADIRTRYNVAQLIGGSTPGPGNLEFITGNYNVDENAGRLQVTLRRVNGQLGTISADVSTSDGTAKAGSNYQTTRSQEIWPEYWLYMRSEGYTNYNYLAVPILSDGIPGGNKILDMTMSNPMGQITLGGEYIPLGGALGQFDSAITIVDNDVNPGTFSFSSPTYSIDENGAYATITVNRAGGSDGDVSVDYATSDGSAVAGLDYTTTTGRLRFSSGQTNRTVTVPIIDNTVAELDETVNLTLSNPTGGANLGSQTTAVLTIIDNDFASGRVSFNAANYTVSEGIGSAIVTIRRTGGGKGVLTVRYDTSDGTATAGLKYTATSGTLSWADGDTADKSFAIPILEENLVEGNQTFNLTLSNPSVTGALGAQYTAAITIVDDDAYGLLAFSFPAYTVDENGTNLIVTVVRQGGSGGTVSVNYASSDGTGRAGVDYRAVSGTLVFDPGVVSRTFSIQVIDNSIVDGNRTFNLALSNPTNAALGLYATAPITIVDDETINEPAGSLDSTFVANGADDLIYSIALLDNGKLMIGGDFLSVNDVYRTRLARLNPDGTLDPSFNPGVGPNASVRTMLLQPDGMLLMGGLFTSVQGTNRNHIARLNTDGVLDEFFNPGAGADNPVFALALQQDGKVLIGGSFNTVNGVVLHGIGRLNTNGVVDATFNPGSSINGSVLAIGIQSDGKVVVGGDFVVTLNNLSWHGLARLNTNGFVDTTFQPTTSTNGAVRSVVIQSDGKLVVGGSFVSVNGVSRNGIARLNTDGSLDPDFDPGSGANGAVYSIAAQADGKLVLGGEFTSANGVTRNRLTRLNPDGSVDSTINFGMGANGFVSAVVIQTDRKIVFGGGFTAYNGIPRNHLARIHGGSISGPGQLEFSAPNFNVVENQTNAVIQVRRTGGTTGTVSADYNTQEGGTAKAGSDYVSVSGTLVFPSGETLKSFNVPVLNDALVEPDETMNLALDNFVGATAGNQPVATLTIKSDDSVVGFSAPAFSVNENVEGGSAVITVLRQGSLEGTVSVDYTTLPGTATAGIKYTPTSGTITYQPGETNKTFAIAIINENLVEGNKTVNLLLSNPSPVSQVQLGQATTVLTIVDDDFAPGSIAFANPTYWVDENGTNAFLTVVRTNGSSGVVRVNYGTSDGSATAGLDYVSSNGVLTFADGETIQTVRVPILNDLIMEDDETLDVTLSNPSGGAILGTITNATLTIINNNFIYGNLVLGSSQFQVNENGTNAIITVLRKNGTTGLVKVDYVTTDGTAVSGLDYTGVSGTLAFAQGEISKTFYVPILDDNLIESNETFNVRLLNPQDGATLGQPRAATVTIIDNDLSVNFDSDNYVVREDGRSAFITVKRSMGGPSTLSVDYATADGTAIAGEDYSKVSGTITFGVGEYSKSFAVPIINDTLIEGNKTVNLILSNPSSGALLKAPNHAILTILDDDGSLITAAGSALTSESLTPANGAIDPGETVTLDFALRNIGKQDTTNLVATLLATNGIAAPSAEQSYGAVIAGGPLVARPFTFKAQGANGETITATFQLSDGTTPLGQVTFAYTLGSTKTTFSNASAISIPDHGAATPYPSTISVSGLVGTVSKVTVSLFRVNHTYPDDIDVLMVSPTGQSLMLMSDSGGGNMITNVTLSFDDFGNASLPDTNQIVSGVYKPSNYNLGDIFPDPAPSEPYGTTLSVFNGINPNGTWALYVVDDSALDLGSIAGGWSMTITTVKSLNNTADLAVSIAAPQTTVALSSNLTYTINVTNQGPMTATGIIITNAIPAGLRLVSATSDQGSWIQSGDQLIGSLVMLTNGASASFEVNVTAVSPGIWSVPVNAVAIQDDLSPTNNTAQTTITVLAPTPPSVNTGTVSSEGAFHLLLSGQPGQGFVIQTSTTLFDWTPLFTNTFVNSTFEFIDTNAPGISQQFYRAVPWP